MYINWKERLEIYPHLRDLKEWPVIDPNTLNSSDRNKFLRNKKIIAKVLAGIKYTEISRVCNVSKSTISYLIKRCLSGSDQDEPALMSGLIPNVKLNKGKRKSPLSELHNEKGSRGSFTSLLDNIPGLKNKLDKMIKVFVAKKAYSQNLTPKIFHAAFLQFLRDANHQHDMYPFDKSNEGYESCRKYLNKQILVLSIPKKKNKRVIITKVLPSRAYQEIQIDSQTLDLTTSINLVVNDVLEPIRLSRLTLFLATDVATDCRVGYYLCINKSPNQYDLLSLFKDIFSKWEPLKLKIPGLVYLPGSGFPSALGENFQNIGLCLIRLDNALCHLAHTVRDYICNDLGATLNLGLPGKPKGRNLIELAFKILNSDIHRFASTTGSHPKDPIKETAKNSKKVPIITLNALDEVLSIIISGHNAKSQNRLAGSTPLDLMKYHMANFPLRMNSKTFGKENNPSIQYKEATVKCIVKENRAPHINFEKSRYTGECLANANIVNKRVILKFDSDDIRKLEVLSIKGESIGFVYAPRTWQNFKHSIVTKRKIFKCTKKRKLNTVDPIGGYFEYLLDNKKIPIIATEIARVYREVNESNIIKLPSKPNENEILNPIIPNKNIQKISKWTPQLVREGLS